MSLNCVTDANPAAYVYQFYLNDSFISNGSSGVLNITIDTDGVYTCVPINKVGTGHNATVSITVVGKFSASLIVFTCFHSNIYRGYYTVARRYEFYVQVARTISHE